MTRNPRPLRIALLAFALGASWQLPAAQGSGGALAWASWQPASFAQAQQQDKHVYLYLEAVWCHWCHVMQQQTFSDPQVQAYLSEHFVPVRVDHDAQPAVADRYRAWGWPANVFLTAQGDEIVLRAGFIAPDDFLRLLRAIVADPSPERAAQLSAPTGSGPAQLPAALRSELQSRHIAAFDAERGGLKGSQKFLDRAHVEYAMNEALRGDAAAAARARASLDAARALIDPVWGGVYQYSTGGRWDRPHYEKLLRIQAEYLRIYALAAAQWPAGGYEQAAAAIVRYVREHLAAPDGGIYNSQDADLVPGQKAHAFFAASAAERARMGAPRIDQKRYVLGNALWLDGLIQWQSVRPTAAQAATIQRLAQWLLAQRDGALFGRGPDGPAGQFLSDNLAAAQAMLSLYRLTTDPRWRDVAIATADAVVDRFSREGSGYLPNRDAVVAPRPALSDNIMAARLFNLLAHYSGAERHRLAAEHAMRYLSLPQVALARIEESGVLLTATELGRAPTHLAVVAPQADPTAQELYTRALAVPGDYKRIEWLDRDGPALLNDNVPYPVLDRAAAYVCTDNRCSLPSFNPAQYGQRIDALVLSDAAP